MHHPCWNACWGARRAVQLQHGRAPRLLELLQAARSSRELAPTSPHLPTHKSNSPLAAHLAPASSRGSCAPPGRPPADQTPWRGTWHPPAAGGSQTPRTPAACPRQLACCCSLAWDGQPQLTLRFLARFGCCWAPTGPPAAPPHRLRRLYAQPLRQRGLRRLLRVRCLPAGPRRRPRAAAAPPAAPPQRPQQQQPLRCR